MLCLTLFIGLVISTEAANLIHNGDFESSTNGWNCFNNVRCQITSDSHSGTHGLMVSNRHHTFDGPSQTLHNLHPNTRYFAEAYIKVINGHAGEMFQHARISLAITKSDNSKQYIHAATNPTVFTGQWVGLQGDFMTSDAAIKSVKFYVEGLDSGTNFILDSASLTELPEYVNWRADSDANIKKYRKGTTHFQIKANNLDSTKVIIEINQTRHEFAFGSAVNAKVYNTSNQRYRDFIFKHFNWATLENSLKWRLMERTRGHINYDLPLSVIKDLRSHNIKVRAHCLLWSVDRHNPQWLQALRGNDLKTAVTERINGVVNKVKGMVEHWDVNNENLHGWMFQTHTGDFDYINDVFRQTHNTDRNVHLFTNDFAVLSQGGLTKAYLDSIMKLKNAGVGLWGIGVQGHLSSCPDPTLFKKRLDILAQAGLPIFITELDFKTPDRNTSHRADCYEKALRIFFGHPAVKGVLLWGFWSLHEAHPSAALVNGPNFQLNLSGKRYLQLIEREWHTYTKRTLDQGSNFDVVGFKGDYEVKMTYNGRVLKTQHFTISDVPETIQINVSS